MYRAGVGGERGDVEKGGYIGVRVGMGGLVGGLGGGGSMELGEGRIINPFYPPPVPTTPAK